MLTENKKHLKVHLSHQLFSKQGERTWDLTSIATVYCLSLSAANLSKNRLNVWAWDARYPTVSNPPKISMWILPASQPLQPPCLDLLAAGLAPRAGEPVGEKSSHRAAKPSHGKGQVSPAFVKTLDSCLKIHLVPGWWLNTLLSCYDILTWLGLFPF